MNRAQVLGGQVYVAMPVDLSVNDIVSILAQMGCKYVIEHSNDRGVTTVFTSKESLTGARGAKS